MIGFVFVALNYIAHATLSSDKSPLIQQDLQFLCSGTFIYEYLNTQVFKSLSSILSIGCSQYCVIEAFSQTLPNASTGPTSSSAPKLRACLASTGLSILSPSPGTAHLFSAHYFPEVHGMQEHFSSLSFQQ